MSLILEALRKSEAERRRGLAPDVAMELPPTPASRQRSFAAWLLPALVVVVLLVLAGWWARREPANPTLEATVTEPPVGTAPPRPDANPQIAPGMPRIEPRPAVVTSAPAAETSATTAATPAPLTPPAMAATRATPVQPPPAPLPTRPLPPPPPAGDISTDTSMLPPVKLSMLMWDDVPAKRFVILNGQRMAEGDRYGAITVIAIERSGVVVEGNGAKARVPLP